MPKVYLKQQKDSSFLVCGEVDFDSAPLLLDSSLNLFKDLDNIKIDFTDLIGANSCVVALILAWQRFASHNNKTLQLQNLPEHIISLIRISNLEGLSFLWSN